jgi:hypothetical protein
MAAICAFLPKTGVDVTPLLQIVVLLRPSDFAGVDDQPDGIGARSGLAAWAA